MKRDHFGWSERGCCPWQQNAQNRAVRPDAEEGSMRVVEQVRRKFGFRDVRP